MPPPWKSNGNRDDSSDDNADGANDDDDDNDAGTSMTQFNDRLTSIENMLVVMKAAIEAINCYY